MYKILLGLLIILISGCTSGKIIKSEFITGKTTKDWQEVKGDFNTVQYSCPKFNIQFHRTKVAEDVSFNSIFSLPIVPNLSSKGELGYLVTMEISYNTIKKACSTTDFRLDSVNFSTEPSSVLTYSGTDGLTCRYTINANKKISEVESIQFSQIEGCNIPNLPLKRTSESKYENNFQPW